MAGCSLRAVIALLVVALHGCSGQLTCGQIQQSADGSVVCAIPPDCCTRLICSLVSLGEVDIRINPCTDPATMSIEATSGGETLFKRSGISTSQKIPVQYGSVLDTSVDLFFNSTMDDVTVGMSAFGFEILPATTIDISDPGCEAGSTSLPPVCFSTEPPPTRPTGVLPPSDPTCQALQQFAGGGNVGTITNNCAVNGPCTTVSCNYLGMFPISLTLLPCNNPPAINFVAYNATGGTVVFNETVTESRRIPLDDVLGPDDAIIVNIRHPCDQAAIIAEVVFSTIFNATVLPATVIPIDRSDCNVVAPTSSPCVTEVPTSFNTLCDAVESALQSSARTCTTNHPDCTTTTCDLGQFNLPAMFSYMILPCTLVPSIRVVAIHDMSVILNETLSKSRIETLNVGPTNVSVNFTVKQSPPYFETIGVGVSLISTDPPIDVPLIPLTEIPLDRCSCAEVTCTTGAPPQTRSSRPDGRITTSALPGAGNPDANRNTNSPSVSDPSSNSGIVAAAVIAALLFVALIAAVVVAAVVFVVIRKKHAEDLKSLRQITYKNLSTADDEDRYS